MDWLLSRDWDSRSVDESDASDSPSESEDLSSDYEASNTQGTIVAPHDWRLISFQAATTNRAFVERRELRLRGLPTSQWHERNGEFGEDVLETIAHHLKPTEVQRSRARWRRRVIRWQRRWDHEPYGNVPEPATYANGLPPTYVQARRWRSSKRAAQELRANKLAARQRAEHERHRRNRLDQLLSDSQVFSYAPVRGASSDTPSAEEAIRYAQQPSPHTSPRRPSCVPAYPRPIAPPQPARNPLPSPAPLLRYRRRPPPEPPPPQRITPTPTASISSGMPNLSNPTPLRKSPPPPGHTPSARNKPSETDAEGGHAEPPPTPPKQETSPSWKLLERAAEARSNFALSRRPQCPTVGCPTKALRMTGPNGLPLKATYRCAEGALQKALLEGVGSYDEQLIADISQMLLDDTTNLAVRPPDRHAFIALVAAGSRAISARFADGTNRVDKSYWRKWSEYCNGVCGTPPLRSDAAANTNPSHPLHIRELNLALGAFLHWCLTEPQYKPASHLARLRGVTRVHRRAHLRFVDLAYVVDACKGIVRLLIEEHGPEIMEVRRKEPLQPWMLRAWFGLPNGTRVGKHIVGNNLAWLGARCFISLAATSGFRKADMALDAGRAFGMSHLSLRYVFYEFDGIRYDKPTKAMLLAANGRTIVYVRPPPSKADPDGSIWGSSPICSVYDPHAIVNFAREMVAYELARGLYTNEERRLAPLLLDSNGSHWSKNVLTTFFDNLLKAIMPDAAARTHSVHSFRIYLACALRDRGVPPATIKEMLRWRSDAALCVYARVNAAFDSATRASATSANVSSVRTTTVLTREDREQAAAAAFIAQGSGASIRPRASAFASEHDPERARLAAEALSCTSLDVHAATPDVDPDLTVFAEVNAQRAALARGAARARRTNTAAFSAEDSDDEGKE